MSKPHNESVTESMNGEFKDNASSKIDAIKQLIFGENMQAYETQFELMKKDILEKKLELEAMMDDVKSELLQSLDNLSTDVNIRITELEDTINANLEAKDAKKVDRKLLGDLLVNLGEKLSS